MRSKKEIVTIRASGWELERWHRAAQFVNRKLPEFVVFAADATARYFRELERQRRPDAVMTRETEKRLLGALLKAAREAIGHVPEVVVSHLQGERHLQADLRRAIEALQDFLCKVGEEYPDS
jgi:hypothetical protein